MTTYNGTISTFKERLVVNVDNCWQQILRGERKDILVTFTQRSLCQNSDYDVSGWGLKKNNTTQMSEFENKIDTY